MENPTILVADGDPKNLQILRDSLEASGFEVIVATDGLQAWQKISSEVPDLILSEVNLPQLDGFQLLEKLKADPATSAIPLMFLTNRRELQDRVRSLRGGVKDYMIKPLHVKEVLARIRMILRRMERIKEEEVDSSRKLTGRLEEFSPVDLIESFGVERKTGVLTLNNENNRSGEIYFREGAVVNATLGYLKAEKAVYQILPWKRGTFTMIFKEITVPDEISVSNLGLLLQGFKRIEEREQLFKQLPSPETTFVMTETFRSVMQKREASPEVAKFISLIDGRRDILQIIDESTYDDIKTLERLVKLYQQGFIKPGKPSAIAADSTTEFAPQIAEPKIVQKILQTPPAQNKKTSAPTSEPRRLDLPSFRPELNLPEAVTPPEANANAETAARVAPTENGEAKPHELYATTTPLAPNDFADPFAKESLERIEENFVNSLTNAKDDHISEADALAAQELSAAQEDEDAIEIREVSSDPEYSPAFEVDRVLRTAGRGLSPEYLEPDLLPLDLGEIMKRPVAPPPFFVEHNGSGNGHETKPNVPPVITPPSEPSPFTLDQFTEALNPPEPLEPESAEVAPMLDADFDDAEDFTQRNAEPLTLAPVEAAPQNNFAEPVLPEAALAPSSDFEIEPLVPEPIVARSQAEPEPMPQPVHHLEAQLREVPYAVAPSVSAPEPEPVVALATPPAMAASTPAERITTALLKLAQHRNLQRPKLLVIGREGRDISTFVRNTLGAESTLRKRESATFQHFEIGERKLMGQPCEIIGISMEQQFTKLLATTSRELSAYIMLVEAHRQQEISYLSYLLSVLKTGYRLPCGLAMMRATEHKNLSKETIRDLLNLAETDYLQECNPGDLTSVAAFLSGLARDEQLAHFADKK